MSYVSGYLVFGVIFVVSIIGYWVVTRSLRDPSRIYETQPSGKA